MPHSFQVDFLHRVVFTRGLLQPANPLFAETVRDGGRHMVALIDDGVARAFPALEKSFRDYLAAHPGMPQLHAFHVVPGGEACKNSRELVDRVLELTNRHHICRQSWVVAVGGGALLDAVGFGAAISHRGVRLIRIPTTVLAQGDAAMGVKNGINRFGKKNYEGAFAVPWAVLNDEEFLPTLPERFWRGGFSEAVKIALLKDPSLFAQLERDAERIRARDMPASLPVIRRSADLHLDHIVRGGDPFEVRQSRPLDYGHWAAHKLEQLTRFELSHGEAVGVGIALDSLYARRIGSLEESDAHRILAVLDGLGLDTWHPRLEDPALFQGLEEFREHLGGSLSITLLKGIGRPTEVDRIELGAMKGAVSALASRRLAKEPT